MLNTYKILGQTNPSSTTLTTLYQSPSYAQSIISLISVCNQSSSGTFRIAIRPYGETIDPKHYIVYDKTLAGNDSFFLKTAISLGSRDTIQVYASSSSFSFSVFGMSIN
jgi:hypothetical protein